MAVIPVALAGRSYEVRVGGGLLANVAGEADAFLRKTHVPIVADANARAKWGDAVENSLVAAGKEARWYDVEPGAPLLPATTPAALPLTVAKSAAPALSVGSEPVSPIS